jgi:ubiquinone/menaquinone biosynthesis C-methylase UbiE
MYGFSWLFRRRKARPTLETWKREQPAATPPESEPRAYLPDAPYLLPKDQQEDQRLHFQHYALHHAFGNHYLAPLSPETRTILDVGTGTGIWAIDMAQQFPHAQIIGVDIAFTSLPHTLPNTCLFAQADVLQGLPFPTHQFDFTHQRLLVLAIPAPRWPSVVRELVRVTRPQGWVELLEAGTTVQNAGPATERLLSWVREISQAQGIELAMVTHLADFLTQAGCQEVEAQDIPVPLGSWAGRSGNMLKLDALRVFEALRPRTPIAPAAFEAMLNAAAEEWEQNHASYVFHAAYGRVALL